MKNNVIFLDIDGVLNHHLWYESKGKDREGTRAECHLDPEKLKLMNQLCKDANCKVVVSSTWRIGFNIKGLQELFESRGGNFDVIDITGRNKEGIRGVEIYTWWNDNKYNFNNYVIFDDDSDMLLWQKDNFFQIDGYCGITPTITYKAERLLNTWERRI